MNRLNGVSWSTVLAVLALLGAVFCIAWGLADNRAILDAAGPLALVGIGFGIISYRDA